MPSSYDKQIIQTVEQSARPLRHSEIASRIAPGNNRAWSKIGTALTHLYRSGLLAREKTDGRYWHYRAGKGEAAAPADLVYAQQLREHIDQLEADNAVLREALAPFARFYEAAKNTERGHGGRDTDIFYALDDVSITLGDLRRAAELAKARP